MRNDRLKLALVGSGAVCVIAFGTAVVLEQSLSMAVFAAGVLAAVALLGAVVLRVSRQLQRSQGRLEALITENHKRASVWNYRLTEAVSGRRVTTVPQRAPGATITRATAAAGSVSRHPQAELLLSSGIFDVDHYSALVGGTFETAVAAASHYLTVNAPKGVMPSVFLDRALLPQPPQQALRNGDVKELLGFLRSPEAYESPLSALFDARHSAVPAEAAAGHPGGVLGAFLEGAGPAATAAVASDAAAAGTKLAAVRQALSEHARSVNDAAELSRPREATSWDRAAETEWLAALRRAEGPELPQISVVMPVKDRASVIGRAIASVVAQTHDCWQLVVVDDGSTDGTLDVVEKLAAEDSRIIVARSAGQGVSAARNTALDLVTGDYVAFLDSDNAWIPQFLETAVGAMLRDGLAAGYAAVAIHDGSGVRYRAFEGSLDDLRTLNHIDLNVLVVRSDIIAAGVRFDESLRRWVDHDFALKVACHSLPRLLPFIGCEYDHSAEANDRITVRESDHWQWVALSRHWVDWESATEPERGLISVVIPTYNDSEMTIQAVGSVLRDADLSGLDVEIVIIDNGSRLEFGQEILASVGCAPRVVYQRVPRNLNFAIGCNLGAVVARGEHVLFLNNDTIVRDGALRRLRDMMDDDRVIGAQPLLVYDDETIQTAGTVFTASNSFPSHLLTGHPPADALPLDGARFDAVTAAALIMRATDIRELRGFDPIYVNGMEDVDLCLRAREGSDRYFAVVPDAVVTHLESKTPGRGAHVPENRRLFLERWSGRLPEAQHELFRRAGFMIAHVGTDGRTDIPGPKPVVVRDPGDRRQRWGIRVASIPGARGDQWGDTHFAESLRVALEKQGCRAVVHRHGVHTTPQAEMDDVVLVIRGLDRVRPMPGKVNILWVISHPEDISIDEVREFDVVFAASVPWAAKMSAASGREVLPLLQATDVDRFHDGVEPVRIGVPLFVGGTHVGRTRPVVGAALEAGLDVAVYGPGWDGQVPQEVLRGEYIDNADLAAHYRGASVVLADHWQLMAMEGFIQNRIFDAVASGCRVVSDHVEGMEETFLGAARSYHSSEELAVLCGPEADSEFPTDDEMRKISASVRELHSFDKRAEELVEALRSVRRGNR